MECSTLIPLTLANAYTRIVLAGDYMQLSTEVSSFKRANSIFYGNQAFAYCNLKPTNAENLDAASKDNEFENYRLGYLP